MALRTNRNLPLSTNTASKISCEITTKLLSPITAQIEPQKLGEVMRSQTVGISYALRLMKGRYVDKQAKSTAKHLAQAYPSHSTIIDYEEARAIGLRVREFNPRIDFGGCFKDLEKELFLPIRGSEIKILNNITRKDSGK